MSTKNQQQSALKATIHKMVREAIREILPDVMNEVLIRTLANANVVQEQRRPAPQPQQRRQAPPQQRQSAAQQRAQQLAGVDRSRSLRDILSTETAGTDFYEQAERAMRRPSPPPQPRRVQQQPIYEEYDQPTDDEWGEDEVVDYNSPPPQQALREQVMAQRISSLPPALQDLAEDTFRLVEDSEYEGDDQMWGDNEFAPTAQTMNAAAPNLNIDRAAQVAGVDFNRAAKLVGLTEKKAPLMKSAEDVHNEAQWKMQQLERKRRELDSKKVG